MFREMSFSLLFVMCFSVMPVKAAELLGKIATCGLKPLTTQCVAEGANQCDRLVLPKASPYYGALFGTALATGFCCATCGPDCLNECQHCYSSYRGNKLMENLRMPEVLSMTGHTVFRKKNS